MTHTNFTTTGRRLRRDSPPMRLYEKAKRLGAGNPGDIDFGLQRNCKISYRMEDSHDRARII